jgi:hypothetical protein
MDGGADDDGPLHLRYSEEGDPARALAMLETETANLGADGIDVLRKLLEQELHEQVGSIWSHLLLITLPRPDVAPWPNS